MFGVSLALRSVSSFLSSGVQFLPVSVLPKTTKTPSCLIAPHWPLSSQSSASWLAVPITVCNYLFLLRFLLGHFQGFVQLRVHLPGSSCLSLWSALCVSRHPVACSWSFPWIIRSGAASGSCPPDTLASSAVTDTSWALNQCLFAPCVSDNWIYPESPKKTQGSSWKIRCAFTENLKHMIQ